MKNLFRSLLVGLALVCLAVLFACQERETTIQGQVVDENGTPLPGAVVRVKTTRLETVTDQEGRFALTGFPSDQTVFVTAWASGYYINGVEDVPPGADPVEIVLHAHHDSDNPEYAWLPSAFHPGQGENQGCAECHSREGTELSFMLPVDEWRLDAHAQSAVNPRFLSMYAGTDVHGNKSPSTRYAINRDYGQVPLRPDPAQPYYGPGYKLDFPETAGNCAACHTPAASIDDPYSIDPSTVTGVPAEGVPCDFCHKIWEVHLDPASGLPAPNMPGVLSFEFRRPPEGHQFFAGPFDDVAPGEDTFSPVQRESQICAPCHFGVFWDALVYNSYGEWLESPYSDPQRAKSAGLSAARTCQDCHMPLIGVTHFALPDQGGTARDPQTIFSHRMPGAADETLLQNAVTLSASARHESGRVNVDVTITNNLTGHHVPTDSPLRQMLLLVDAKGPGGERLKLLEGPTIPDWGGVGDPAQGYFAGLPGKGYAKILMELWTEISPTGAYWNPTRILSDNRLPALGSDTTHYVFAAPENSKVTLEVKLIFRRAFIDLMSQKDWSVPDILMEKVEQEVP